MSYHGVVGSLETNTGTTTTSADGPGDPYAATASMYDLLITDYRAQQVAALETLRPRLLTEVGPVLDIGAGSGLNSAWVLTQLPTAEVVAIEPSPAMRALTVGRVAGHPEWFSRITIRPEDFFSAPLPPHLGGAIMLGTLGHFDPGERAAVLAELAARLPEGGAALIDLQSPETPTLVEPFEIVAGQIGQLTYRAIAEGWPTGGEAMGWRMTYLTLDGERVLLEDTVDHVFHHPAPETVVAEAAAVGLRMERADTTHWLLTREAGAPTAP